MPRSAGSIRAAAGAFANPACAMTGIAAMVGEPDVRHAISGVMMPIRYHGHGATESFLNDAAAGPCVVILEPSMANDPLWLLEAICDKPTVIKVCLWSDLSFAPSRSLHALARRRRLELVHPGMPGAAGQLVRLIKLTERPSVTAMLHTLLARSFVLLDRSAASAVLYLLSSHLIPRGRGR